VLLYLAADRQDVLQLLKLRNAGFGHGHLFPLVLTGCSKVECVGLKSFKQKKGHSPFHLMIKKMMK
jgi:hypothetical protein